jgi:hypothetical protein
VAKGWKCGKKITLCQVGAQSSLSCTILAADDKGQLDGVAEEPRPEVETKDGG